MSQRAGKAPPLPSTPPKIPIVEDFFNATTSDPLQPLPEEFSYPYCGDGSDVVEPDTGAGLVYLSIPDWVLAGRSLESVPELEPTHSPESMLDWTLVDYYDVDTIVYVFLGGGFDDDEEISSHENSEGWSRHASASSSEGEVNEPDTTHRWWFMTAVLTVVTRLSHIFSFVFSEQNSHTC